MAIALTETYLVGPHKNPQGSDRIWFGSDRSSAAYYVTKVSFKVPAGFIGSSLSIITKGRNDYGGSTAMNKGKVYNFATTTVNVIDYSEIPQADTTFTTTTSVSQGSITTLTATINKIFDADTTYYLYIWGANPSSVYSLLTHVSTELTLTGTYIISYDANGGSGAPSAQNKTPGVTLTLSSIKPTREGYTFSKWNTKADGTGTNYNSGANYTADTSLSLYAIWNINKVQFAYNPNGGTVDADGYGYSDYGWITKDAVTYFQTLNYNDSNDLYDATTFGLTRTGYTFDGHWYLYNNIDGITTTRFRQDTSYNSAEFYHYADTTKTVVNTPLVSCWVYAGWTANNYIVTFDPNGGSIDTTTIIVTYDSNYDILPTPTRIGYTFNGWFTAKTGGTQITADSTVNITSDQVLYAQWTVKVYKYTLGETEGVITEGSTTSGNKNYGSMIILKAVPKSGYTWNAWKSSNTTLQQDLIAAETSFTMPAGNLTMTPTIITNGYTIVFNGNGATEGSMNNMICNYDTYYHLDENKYSKPGYEFLGWSTDSASTTATYSDRDSIINLTSENNGIIILYAIWKARSQTFIWAQYDDGSWGWRRALKYVYTE